MAYLIQQRSAAPGWIENTQWVRLLSPAYYVVSISTVAYFLIVPIMTHRPVVILLALAPIAGLCNIVFGPRYATVRMTAGGRTLSVALFAILAVLILPTGILWFNSQ
jgi:hypothetical protein